MILKVQVTEEDIRLGRKMVDYCVDCAVWRALGRALTEKFEWFNTKDLEIEWFHKASLQASAGKARIKLPKAVEQFQETLSDYPNANVKPFAFTVEVNL